jgi:FAD/FMN-containing dehydrogenase
VGDILFDPFDLGRYATDASFYQIKPFGVVVPRTMDDALRAMAIARDDGRIVTRAAAAPRNAARPSTTALSSTVRNI